MVSFELQGVTGIFVRMWQWDFDGIVENLHRISVLLSYRNVK